MLVPVIRHQPFRNQHRHHALPQATSLKYHVDRSCFILLNTLLRSMFGLQPKQHKFRANQSESKSHACSKFYMEAQTECNIVLFLQSRSDDLGCHGSDYTPSLQQ